MRQRLDASGVYRTHFLNNAEEIVGLRQQTCTFIEAKLKASQVGKSGNILGI
jgi:hypothetical protein